MVSPANLSISAGFFATLVGVEVGFGVNSTVGVVVGVEVCGIGVTVGLIGGSAEVGVFVVIPFE